MANIVLRTTKGTPLTIAEVDGNFTALNDELATKAPTASPVLSGVPTAPTAAPGTNTTQLATTEYVIAERGATATLTNKTISGADNTITDVSITSSTTGTLPVNRGGTGTTSLSGVVIGNGTSAFSAKANPSGDFVGSTDTQTLTNKTISFASNTMPGVQPTLVSGTNIKTINGNSVLGSGDLVLSTGEVTLNGVQTLTNKTISGTNNTLTGISLTSSVTGTLPVGSGGTGATTLSGVVIGNGTSAFTTKTNPTGEFVGTTDTQTLTNKTISFAQNNLTGVQPTLVSGTNIKTINGNSVLGSGDLVLGGGSADLVTANTSSTPSEFKVPFLNTTGNISGSYGLLHDSSSSLTYNPSTNTLVASTFSGSLSGNASTATTLQTSRTINGTSFNGSSNITTANWGTARTFTIGSTGKSVDGSTSVSWTLSEIGAQATLVSGTTIKTINGSSILGSGDITAGDVTLSGTQTLTNKTISGSSNTITNVSLSTGVTGTLSVGRGGTGATTLSGVVIGNGTSAFTAKTNPSGAFVGTTDIQTLTNKTISFANNTLTGVQPTLVSGTTIKTINGSSILGSGDITAGDVTLSGVQTLTNKTINGSNNTITNVSLSTGVTGTLPVGSGGTGATTLSGVVIGNGTSAFTTKTNPTGDFVGTTDSQTLTNKTLSGAVLNDGYTEEVFAVSGTAPALSPNNGSIQTWTLSGSSTPTAGTWNSGQSITLMIDDGANYDVTWTSLAVTWKTDGGYAPNLADTGFNAIQLWKVGTVIYGAKVGDV